MSVRMSSLRDLLAFGARFVVIVMMLSSSFADEAPTLVNEFGGMAFSLGETLVGDGLPVVPMVYFDTQGPGGGNPVLYSPVDQNIYHVFQGPGGEYPGPFRPPGPVDYVPLEPIDDPYVKGLACWAVSQNQSAFSDIYQSRPIRLVSASKEVADGDIYRLRFTVGVTTCLQGAHCDEPLELLGCNAEDQEGVILPKFCKATILDERWLYRKTLELFRCVDIAFSELDTIA